jgi:hypothetical protein
LADEVQQDSRGVKTKNVKILAKNGDHPQERVKQVVIVLGRCRKRGDHS